MFGTARQIAELEGRRADRAEERCRELEAEVRRLTNLLVDLKRDGFAILPPVEEPEPDPLEERIREIMHNAGFTEADPGWAQNARFVRQELEKDGEADPEEIAEEIRAGDDPSHLLD